ncbi:hypothetical protein RJ640_018979 [Escallonia rubra]|uniref:Ribosomal protein L25 beta domain-containing protein n=1 Tax=Escallonia rubra TaxID=112253 RepID=A0AA88U9J2_9ASTE|nr:hypothetical protein RJ640_018979 [Escallonia rubra]
MLICRRIFSKALHHHHHHHHRHFTQAAAALLLDHELPPLTYLEDLPKPDPKHAETILAVPRAVSGKNISAKERKVGRVPAIVFEQEDGQHGGNKRLISVNNNQIKKLVSHCGRSFFLSRLFDLEVRAGLGSDEVVEKVRVLPRLSANIRRRDRIAAALGLLVYQAEEKLQRWCLRRHAGEDCDDCDGDGDSVGCAAVNKAEAHYQLHMHAGKHTVLNVTFIRAPSHALLKVEVPLVFIGDDVCPGLRKGAYFNVIKRKVKYLCPADIIPPYIEVDLSELDVGQKLVMGDLKVHPALKLLGSNEEPICKIMGSRVSEQQKKAK